MLASAKIQGSFWSFAVICMTVFSTVASLAHGQVIVPASEVVGQGNNPAVTSTPSAQQATAAAVGPEQLLKDARAAMGVRNYDLAAQLIQQAEAFAESASLDYAPAKAKQELQFWMQRDGQAVAADSDAVQGAMAKVTDQGAGTEAGNQPTMSEAEIEMILTTLLQARQSLALGDTPAAHATLKTVTNRPMDFAQVGDSPKFVEAMIERQNELSDMANRRDANYNQAAATFLLSQAEALIHYEDFATAETLIQQARKFPASFDGQTVTPDELQQRIAAAKSASGVGVSVAMSDAAAPAASVEDNSGAKADVARLVSMAQLAIAKEQWTQADAMIQAAQSLNVPETEFAADEVRPWQLELQVRQALNRTGPSMTLTDQPADTIVDGQVQQASATGASSPVIQAKYDPNTDQTRNVQVAGYEAAADAKSFDPIPSRGMQLYQSGVDALNRADKAKAIEYFESAWQFQDQLDVNTRQAIQDRLAQLTPNGVPTKQVSASINQENALELDEVRSQRQAVYRRFQSEVLKQRALAERQLEDNPRAALETMSTLRNRIAQSNLDRDSQRPLLVSIDRNISEMQEYIEKNLPEIENREINSERKDRVERRAERRVETEKQMQKLVEDYNALMEQQRFAEAMVVVRQAVELDPDSEIAVVLKEKATNRMRTERMKELRDQKADGIWNVFNEIEADMVQGDYANPEIFNDPDDWTRKSRKRLNRAEERKYSSDSERRIWNQLENEKVQGEYRGTLAEAVEQLAMQTGINIVFDDLALRNEGIEKDMQIDVPIVAPITLKSALDIILGSSGLMYVVDSEVIKVTSRQAQQSNLVSKIYYIGDLVMPASQPTNPFHMNAMPPNGQYPTQFAPGGVMNVSHQPNAAMAQQIGGGNIGGGGGLSYGGGPQSGNPAFASMGGRQLGGVTEGDFEPLIELIQNTVQPDSWSELNDGPGTIQAFVTNLSLIVSQTQEVQDEIQDLLEKLRQLNDVQIVIEVRFMILQDDFFERMGVDFQFNLEDNSGIPNGVGGIAALPDTFPKSAIVGNTAAGVNVAGLDIPFTQGGFAQAIPTGFDASSAASFGFAILSDIEVFFLLQAAKGNTRSNVMQAPTVTMFNGQSASISDGSQRPFVTSVVPVVGDFAVGQQPIITMIPDGTNLSVQAVVSDDRRFVRLNLSPFFSEITDVQTFTFDGQNSTERTTDSVLDDLLDLVDGGSNADDGDDELVTRRQGVTVQQPVVAFTSVNTVVSVPDGGTVLMGGIKRMTERRIERGVPMLSNIPYVNRLFKNVATNQETSNLMMMVTPRILIQEELEEDQVGLIQN